MIENIATEDELEKSPNKRHIKVCEINHKNNLDSDYTEKMESLEKSFDYASNSEHYWSDPELSILYGTPLYAEASPSQKLALNHLYWPIQYDFIAASESSAIHYNQVTSGVFGYFSDYETLCSTLDLETEQEYTHIHTFQKVSYKIKTGLFGKKLLGSNPKKVSKGSLREKLLPKVFNQKPQKSSPSDLEYRALHFINKMMLQNANYCYSTHLQELEAKGNVIPPVKGYINSAIPQSLHKFLTFNWGSSPFLACQHFTYRFTANLALKSYEYRYTKYFRDLAKKGDFIPTPTAISHYHLLDESFHTTTSQLIGRDMYKDFSQPTAYEKLVSNVIIYMIQKGLLGQLSGGMMSGFREDRNFLPFYYKLLRSPVFDMSHEDALHWLEKSLCDDHEGFHVNLKYHQRLQTDLCRFTSNLDYLWPINREMKVMANGGSINKAIQNNQKSLREFSASIAV
ncbi:hypothetical protein VB620_10965 [Nodularia harveyana UHCC-0300]|uniref:PuwK n=1 Tax=Nodularia harveyana UHCC-0300 TaxID=2974287 RepID=A0A9E7VDD8_9CYAN|nr:hypothetical protein [Nodularia harveyana]MEA5581857.1 hypothetical protein [Nodularia harveyana UHCC-0300]UZC80153.1 PuwK [Nodularia harveyana UHCC-0300]